MQGSSLPVFRGRGRTSLLCEHCSHVLVEGYEPRKLIAIGIECFQCSRVTRTPEWGAHESLPHNLVTCGSYGRFLLKGTVDLGTDVALSTDQEIARVRSIVGVAAPAPTPLHLTRGGLEALALEINTFTNNAFSRAVGDTRAASAKGNKRFTRYPAAWALVHLERQLSKGVIDLDSADGIALAFLHWLRDAASRWRHHPLFPLVARSLVHEFHHAVTMLVIASYLSEHGNHIGFTNTPMEHGRSPDLYVNTGPTSRLSIEVKAPEPLQWPAREPEAPSLVRIIENQAKASRDQMTGSAGGILVLGAFHPEPRFPALLGAALKRTMTEKKISKRIAAIATVSLSSIVVGSQVKGGIASNLEAVIAVEPNPRFPGRSPVRTD